MLVYVKNIVIKNITEKIDVRLSKKDFAEIIKSSNSCAFISLSITSGAVPTISPL